MVKLSSASDPRRVTRTVLERCAPGFLERLPEIDLEELEQNESSVYAVDEDMALVYFSPAWEKFALSNGGDAVLTRCGLGTNVLDVCGPLRPFYETHFGRCLAADVTWSHDYECSGADLFRRFHMNVYPLRKCAGLLIVNTLVVEQPIEFAESHVRDPLVTTYAQPNGLIVQCSHCRRVQRGDGRPQWDWIPGWVRRPPENTTGGLCKPCYVTHYPPSCPES